MEKQVRLWEQQSNLSIDKTGKNLKVLLITGILAEDSVKRYADESDVNTQTIALKIPVAALLTPEKIVAYLKDVDVKDFDIILVPGLIKGDTSLITKALGIQTFKGPRYAADLPTVLDMLKEQLKLSTVVPACDLLKEKLAEKALQELEKVEQNKNTLLKKPGNMQVRDLAIGKSFPMRVMAEIVDAAVMDDKKIQRLAKQFVQDGASIVDVGMIAGTSRPADARRAIKAVKAVVNVPVSIDSLDSDEIKEAVLSGADVILSADEGNLEKIAPFAKDVIVIVIPTNQHEGYYPKEPQVRVQFLESLIEKAKKLGFTKIIGDLILDPLNVLDSFSAFQEFKNRNPEVPLLIGISNVTELMDADSAGINCLLSRLASEIQASILLVTERSPKTKGTVKETLAASKLMFLAKKRNSVPKDLGVDVLVFKDRKSVEEPYCRDFEEKVKVVIASEEPKNTVLDKKGLFRITLDREEPSIVALHYQQATENPVNVIRGKTAEKVYSEILRLNLISGLDHSAYLGRELAKAEICLNTGVEYIQDRQLFSK